MTNFTEGMNSTQRLAKFFEMREKVDSLFYDEASYEELSTWKELKDEFTVVCPLCLGEGEDSNGDECEGCNDFEGFTLNKDAVLDVLLESNFRYSDIGVCYINEVGETEYTLLIDGVSYLEEELNVDIDKLTEEIDVRYEYRDEYCVCDECGRLIRTEPDCYGWMADFALLFECELVCGHCISAKYQEEYVDTLINDHTRCNTILSDKELEELGFTCLDKVYESGWYGRNDNPGEILKELQKAHEEIIFNCTSVGQFHTGFEVWVRGTYEVGVMVEVVNYTDVWKSEEGWDINNISREGYIWAKSEEYEDVIESLIEVGFLIEEARQKSDISWGEYPMYEVVVDDTQEPMFRYCVEKENVRKPVELEFVEEI